MERSISLHIKETVIIFMAFQQDTFYLSLDHRKLFYNAYIKPHIEYCSVVWCNSSSSNVNKMNTLQRRACKLILAHEYNGLEESLKRPDMLSFDQSVFRNKAKMIYKVYINLAPNYLQEM